MSFPRGVILDAAYDPTDQATTYVGGSIAPLAGSRLLLFFATYGSVTAPGVTPSGLSNVNYTLVTNQTDGGSGVSSWSAVVGANPGSGALTFTVDAACIGLFRAVIQLYGDDPTQAFPGNLALGGGPGDTTSVTSAPAMTWLSPIRDNNSRGFGFWMHRAQEATTPETGWEKLRDANGVECDFPGSGPARGHMVAANYSMPDITATASWATSVRWQGLYLEVAGMPDVYEPQPGVDGISPPFWFFGEQPVLTLAVASNDVSVTGYLCAGAVSVSTVTADRAGVGIENVGTSALATVTHTANVVGLEPVGTSDLATVSHDTSIVGHTPIATCPISPISHDESLAGILELAVSSVGIYATADYNVAGLLFTGTLPVGTISHNLPLAEAVPVGTSTLAPISHDLPLAEAVPVGTSARGPINHDLPLAQATYPAVAAVSTITHDATVAGLEPVGVVAVSTVTHTISIAGLVELGVVPVVNLSFDYNAVGYLTVAVSPVGIGSHDISQVGQVEIGTSFFPVGLHEFPAVGMINAGVQSSGLPYRETGIFFVNIPVGVSPRSAATYNAVVAGLLNLAGNGQALVTGDRSGIGVAPIAVSPRAVTNQDWFVSTNVPVGMTASGPVTADRTVAGAARIGAAPLALVSREALVVGQLESGLMVAAVVTVLFNTFGQVNAGPRAQAPYTTEIVGTGIVNPAVAPVGIVSTVRALTGLTNLTVVALGDVQHVTSVTGKVWIGLWSKFDPGPPQYPQGGTDTDGPWERTGTFGFPDETTVGSAADVTTGTDGRTWTS